MNFYEVIYHRTLNQIEKNEWQGTRAFLCDSSMVSSVSRSLWDQPFPSLTGIFTPRVYKTSATYCPFDVSGTALIVAYYRTKPVPGKAIIYTRSIPIAREALFDLDGKVVKGPYIKTNDTTELGLWEWRVAEGSNIYYDGICRFRVVTAIARADYNDEALWDIRGTLNASNFNLAGYKAPETLRFMGYASTDRYQQDPIDIEYTFDYNPAGWNTELKSTLGSWMLEDHQVYYNTGQAITNKKRTIQVFREAWDSKTGKPWGTESRRIHVPANWNAIKDTSGW